jgi:hypothetical protein
MKKPPEGGFSVLGSPGRNQPDLINFFRDLIGQSGLWPAQQEWLRRYFVFEPATYGLEGLKNLDKQCLTMVYSALVLGVSFGTSFLGSSGVS